MDNYCRAGSGTQNKDGLYTLYLRTSLTHLLRLRNKMRLRDEFKLVGLESVDDLGFLVLHLKYCRKAAKL